MKETRQIWKNARRLPDICKNTQQMSCSLLAFFISAFFVIFSGPSLTEMKLYGNFFLVLIILHEFSKPNSKKVEDEAVYCAGDEHFWHRIQTCFALVTNWYWRWTWWKCAFKLQPPPPTHTASYQQLSSKHISRWLLYSLSKTKGS